MEDKRGGGVSEPPLSGKITDESVVENMGRDNQVEEVFGEGDGEEIMVEIVGSDVFVDGVSGNGEGDCEMAEAADSDGGVVEKIEESKDVSREGDEKHGLTEEVDTRLSMSVGVRDEKVSALPVGRVGGVDDEARNYGIGIANESSTEDMETSEEKRSKDEVVAKDGSELVTPESSNRPMEVASDDKTDTAEEKEETDDGNDGVAGEVHSVDTSGGGERLVSSQKDGSVRAKVEFPSTDGDEEDVRAAEGTDSIPKPDTTADVPDESQNCSDKSHDAKLNQNDQTAGAPHIDLESIHESSCGSRKGETKGNDECSKNESDLETQKAQNDVFSGEPIQLADGGDAAVINKDESLCVDVKDDADENAQNKAGMSCSNEKEIVQSDQPVIATTVGAETGDQDVGSGEKETAIDSETPEKSMASHESAEIPAQHDSAEHMHIPEEGVSAEVKAADVMETDTIEASIVQEGTGNADLLVSPTDTSLVDGSVNQAMDMPKDSNGFCVAEAVEGHESEVKPMDVEEERESHGEQEADAELSSEGTSSESDKSKISIEKTVKYTGSLRMKQSGYLMSPENEGCFEPSDLVWGKVRSHPWWPGQICDQAHASEKAVKHHKKDAYLVAYFGDQTFAWNESSALKPFRSYFSQIEKQSNSELFHNAVDCALEEVERRVQLGLSCSCTPKDAYAKIETQVMENTGIREESSRRYGVDQSSCASCFEPSEFLEFITSAASCTSSGADQLDLVIARVQLSAFYSFKGYRSPIEFPSSGKLVEVDGDTVHKHIPKEVDQSRKEKSMMELMGDGEYSLDVEDDSLGKKRKALDSLGEGSEKRVSTSAAKVSTPTSQAPKPSFKIGECIRRVANKLASSPSLVKGNDEMVVDGSPSISEKQTLVVSAESLSVNDMLSQLELVAREPKKRHGNDIRSFFMGFRSSTALSRRSRKKRSEQAVGGSGEEFEFDDVNDSYWTDRIVQNYSADQLLHESMNGAGNLQLASFHTERTAKPGRKPHSRKRYYMGGSPTSATEIDETAKRIKQESSPAELILNFSERNRVPSEININKMFRRFGPLMESETEVDHESGSAKVIFKRGSDAEVARNSAEKFSIFGPVVVSYQIGYSPVISVRISPVTLSLSQEEATLML